MSEVQRVQDMDPNFLVEIAIGPPSPELVPQDPNTGLRLGGQYTNAPRQFVFKKAHLSAEDFRIFAKEGQLMCVMHHAGKNPYASLDPLGLQNQMRYEWKSLTWITGYHGMPALKVRPKTISRHGRQYVTDYNLGHTYFSVANKSRLSTMSIRHNMEVCEGESDKVVYDLEVDLAGRTLQFKNTKGQLVAIAAKSTKALILNAALGAGSEMIIDVAPGVDWTAILACMMAIQQVGAHLAKDAISNFVTQPLTNQAQDAALGAVGLDGIANKIGGMTSQGIYKFSQVNTMYQQFFR